MKRPDGQVTENAEEMGDMVSDFYKTLYRSKGVTDIERVLDTVPTKVTAAMNEGLMAPFDQEEVKTALFQMFPTKAPGPDGMPAHFFSGIGSYVVRR